jgi:mitochondrial fission protein ELM1
VVLDAQQVESVTKALIVSDGKKGHLNQSIALCKYLNVSYDVAEVRFKHRFYKSLSYLLDRAGVYTDFLFEPTIRHPDSGSESCMTDSGSQKLYDFVLCAGSGTYYAAKTFAKKLGAKSISMMLPKGYRYDFDLIFAQSHDHPPHRKNIVQIPANFSYVQPQGLYKAKQKKAIGIVIGGDNKVFRFSVKTLRKQLDAIKALHPEHEIAITTSPRTSNEIEKLIEGFGFDYEVIFSKNPINPIPDFLAQCETVFITADSTSMISEAISYGEANVVVLPLKSEKENKFTRFIKSLEREGYLHIFDGTIKDKNKKIDFKRYLQKKIDLTI